MPIDWDARLPPVELLLDEITTLVSHAEAAVVAIDRSTVMRRTKRDLSPVTAADAAAQSIIIDGLTQIVPGLPIVSEETSELNPTPVAGCIAAPALALSDAWAEVYLPAPAGSDSIRRPGTLKKGTNAPIDRTISAQTSPIVHTDKMIT
jgi:hypothetical protein